MERELLRRQQLEEINKQELEERNRQELIRQQRGHILGLIVGIWVVVLGIVVEYPHFFPVIGVFIIVANYLELRKEQRWIIQALKYIFISPIIFILLNFIIAFVLYILYKLLKDIYAGTNIAKWLNQNLLKKATLYEQQAFNDMSHFRDGSLIHYYFKNKVTYWKNNRLNAESNLLIYENKNKNKELARANRKQKKSIAQENRKRDKMDWQSYKARKRK